MIPAHYQVPFSRLGHYRTSQLDQLVYETQDFTEQWAHEASIIPMATWPLLRYRMKDHRVRPYGFEKFMAKDPDYLDRVLEDPEQAGVKARESGAARIFAGERMRARKRETPHEVFSSRGEIPAVIALILILTISAMVVFLS